MPALPKDLIEYLSQESNRTLRFNEGEVLELTLYGLDEIATRIFDVDTSDFDELPAGFERRYEFEGMDLVKTCKSYNPEGIFIWFPALSAYGAWDCDHHRIMLFPGKTWMEIMREPTWYFNGQWYPERIDHAQLKPWENESSI